MKERERRFTRFEQFRDLVRKPRRIPSNRVRQIYRGIMQIALPAGTIIILDYFPGLANWLAPKKLIES